MPRKTGDEPMADRRLASPENLLAWGALSAEVNACERQVARVTVPWAPYSAFHPQLAPGRAHCDGLHAHILRNSTLRRLKSAVVRTAVRRPYMRLIEPRHLTWSERTRDEDEDGGAAAAAAAEAAAAVPAAAAAAGSNATVANATASHTPAPAAATTEDHNWLVFLLVTPGSPYSEAMDAAVEMLLGAFPDVMFLRGQGSKFHRFTAQYAVRGFPRLLLFRDGLLVSRFASDSPDSVAIASFLSRHTGKLPAALLWPCLPADVVLRDGTPPWPGTEVAVGGYRLLEREDCAYAYSTSGGGTGEVADLFDAYIAGKYSGRVGVEVVLSSVFVALRVLYALFAWVRRRRRSAASARPEPAEEPAVLGPPAGEPAVDAPVPEPDADADDG